MLTNGRTDTVLTLCAEHKASLKIAQVTRKNSLFCAISRLALNLLNRQLHFQTDYRPDKCVKIQALGNQLLAT
jgi:hypothetical protein